MYNIGLCNFPDDRICCLGSISLQWCHNGRDGVSNHRRLGCLLNRLLRRRSKKTSKLRVAGLYMEHPPVTGEFPAQRVSNAENIYIYIVMGTGIWIIIALFYHNSFHVSQYCKWHWIIGNWTQESKLQWNFHGQRWMWKCRLQNGGYFDLAEICVRVMPHVVFNAIAYTVFPKKYAHGFCFAVLCCGYTLIDFPISTRLTSLALWQSNDCPSASKATLMNMDKYFMWIHYERLHNHNKAKHNKTVCIFLGIYCISTDG